MDNKNNAIFTIIGVAIGYIFKSLTDPGSYYKLENIRLKENIEKRNVLKYSKEELTDVFKDNIPDSSQWNWSQTNQLHEKYLQRRKKVEEYDCYRNQKRQEWLASLPREKKSKMGGLMQLLAYGPSDSSSIDFRRYKSVKHRTFDYYISVYQTMISDQEYQEKM